MAANTAQRLVGSGLSAAVHVSLAIALFATWRDGPVGQGPREHRQSKGAGVTVLQMIDVDEPASHATSDAARQTDPRPDAPREARSIVPAKLVASDAASIRPEAGGPTAANTPDVRTVSEGGFDASSVSDYRARLQAHLAHYRRYPETAVRQGSTGTVLVRFLVDDNGTVRDAWIDTPSGSVVLDDEAVAALRRASPLPAFPPGWPGVVEMTLPIAFQIG